ncbi:MAG: site-2 protease family protein [Candidatus Micrarchaeia archaeon]
MEFYIRPNISSRKELKDLLVADLVLTLAFSLVMIGGIQNIQSMFYIFLYFLPISFVAVSLSFILHELMHKYTAERFGAIAGFRTSPYGLAITLITSFFGFLIGVPGATMIYGRFAKREEGIVSIAGPLTNFTIFVVFLLIGLLAFPNFLSNVLVTFSPSDMFKLSFFQNTVNMVLFISILLAFFNMLPIYPLDGSKVLRWNKYIFISVVAVIFILLSIIVPIVSLITGLAFMLIIAYIFSFFYKGLF